MGSINSTGTGQYRHSSQPFPASSGRRSGGTRGPRGAGYGGSGRSASAFGVPTGHRSMSNSSGYRQNHTQAQHMRPYGPPVYDPSVATDPYAMSMIGQEHNPYYMNGGMYPGAPYMPYGYPPLMTSPTTYPVTSPNGGPAGPPIPMPITQMIYPLDPLRYWLLGQVRFSIVCALL